MLQATISGLAIGATYGMIALGFSLGYRTTRVLNFAQGDLVALAAYLVWFYMHQGAPLALAAVASVLTVGLITGAMELLILRPLYKFGMVYPVFATFGVAILIESGIQLWFGPIPKVIPSLLSTSSFAVGDVHISPFQLLTVGVALAGAFGAAIILRKTRHGRALRAVAADPSLANLFGIRSSLFFTGSFVLSGVAAAIAGVFTGPLASLQPTMGTSLALVGFTAALLGGMGSLEGAVLGGFAVGVIENIAVLKISPGYEDAISFALMIAVLLLRPSGLIGEADVSVRGV